MKSPTDLGVNRSGLATAPLLAPRALEVPELTRPSMLGDEKLIALERQEYARAAEPIATMPPVGDTVLLDKLGERLAFERSGTRLYEALLSKYDSFGGWKGGPRRSELEHFHRQELNHFRALAKWMEQLGADKTAVTPSADVHDVLASGLRLVLADPSTSLLQGLEAILVAELTDNDCWMNLVRLALAYGQRELARQCEEFLAEEDEHLLMVREWISSGLSMQAFGQPHVLADIGTRRDSSSPDLGPPADVAPRVDEDAGVPVPLKRKRGAKKGTKK